jgi:hypothetical protein
MRYRLLASYQGAPYEAGVGPGESGVVLFAACPPPEDLRFEPATGHWRKAVRRRDVQALYESRPVGLFRGERCVVLDDLSDRLHIAYLGHDALKAEQLGYWEVDRGVFELIAPRQQVTEVVEERLPVTEGSGGDDSGIYAQNGHRAAMLPAGQGRAPLGDAADPLAGTPVPRALGLPGYGRGASGSGPLGTAGPVSIPPADAPPLPLEAEAMRAAAEATRRDHDLSTVGPADIGADLGEADHGEPATPEPGAPVIPVTPAGLSEPSVAVRAPGAGATTVPSWTPPAPTAGFGGPGGAAAWNGTYGHPGAQAVTEAPALDPYQQKPQQAEAPAESPQTDPAVAAGPAVSPSAGADAPSGPGAVRAAATLAATPMAPAPVSEPAESGQAPATAAAGSQPAPRESRASRRRRSARRRLPTQRIFRELADQAGIRPQAYAIGEDVDGAMCLVQTPDGFEVFNSVGGARHEVRVFADEESAYFYLFGVLAAEAVRTGSLGVVGP